MEIVTKRSLELFNYTQFCNTEFLKKFFYDIEVSYYSLNIEETDGLGEANFHFHYFDISLNVFATEPLLHRLKSLKIIALCEVLVTCRLAVTVMVNCFNQARMN
jgi:hypothetical protein